MKKCKGSTVPFDEYVNHLITVHKIYQGVIKSDEEGIRTMMKTKLPG